MGVNPAKAGSTSAVTIRVDPVTVGRAQGREAAAYARATWPGEAVGAIVLMNATKGADAAALAAEAELKAGDPDAFVLARYRTNERDTAATLSAAFDAHPDARLVIGEHGPQAAEALGIIDAAPRDAVVFAAGCSPDVITLMEQGTGPRSCVDGMLRAGRTAAVVLLGRQRRHRRQRLRSPGGGPCGSLTLRPPSIAVTRRITTAHGCAAGSPAWQCLACPAVPRLPGRAPPTGPRRPRFPSAGLDGS